MYVANFNNNTVTTYTAKWTLIALTITTVLNGPASIPIH